jgi:hypothetical protein
MTNRPLTRVLVHSSSSVINLINRWRRYGEQTRQKQRHSHIPPDLVVERARRSLKASGREDLQIKEPITGG